MLKPVKIDLPYPSLNGIEPNYKIAKVIIPAFSGGHSELNAILQYIYHFFNFNELKNFDLAETLMGIALCEMEHLQILGKLLIKLGVDPVFAKNPPYKTEFYSTKSLSYSRLPIKMLLDNISGEMLAINDYKQMSDQIQDEKVLAVISRLLLDETLHLTVLKDSLKDYMKEFNI